MGTAKFLEGKIYRHIINMALPGLVVIAVNLSIVLVDTYFISRLGHLQLTAMGFIFPVIETIQGISLGIGIATSTGIARFLGQNEFTKAQQYFCYSLIISFICGTALTVLGYTFHQYVFKLLGANHLVLPYIWDFIKVWLASMFVYLLLFAMSFGMRGHGEIKLNSTFFIIVAVLNLLFDPPLIFGWFGLPKLGITGAALAGFLARTIILFVYFIFLIQKKWLKLPEVMNLRYYSKNFFKTAIPASLTNFIPPLSIAITTYLLAGISLNAVAAFGIATRIQMFFVIPLFAISGAISSIVAQNYGANLYHRSNETLHYSLLSSIAWGLTVTLIIYLIRFPLVETFSQQPAIVKIGTDYLSIVPVSYLGWGMIMMFCSYFNAIGKPLYATFISLLRMLIIFIPLALLLKHFYSDTGIFFALSISNLMVAFLAWRIQKSVG